MRLMKDGIAGNRIITLGLFPLVILIFVSYFAALRTAFPSGQPVEGFFTGLIHDAQKEDWPAARRKAGQLKRIWSAKKSLILLNYAERIRSPSSKPSTGYRPRREPG